MNVPCKTFLLSVRDNEHCKRLSDPITRSIFHLEALLPFSEAAKLERGNANVRPASEIKRPYKDMLKTVDEKPETFHLKNRGITYLCDRFEFENSMKRITVHIPNVPPDRCDDDTSPPFGIADGGH